MKKFLLKIALCATMLLALGGVITPLVVSAEESVETPEIITEIADTDIVSSEDETAENSPEIVEETETSKWFDETLKPLLLEYGAEVAAIATVVFVCLRDLKPRDKRRVGTEPDRVLRTIQGGRKGCAATQ